ncbi:threonine--tRNA ligase [Victivallis vadensis]|uniref:Threonine--tRNA ligase n=1 Tax=Victivallis vadensis TaxID=172901 RepID=A0A848AUF5_9BACT|nr:threonine--tRNA ligase [Victivallis vadensis]NMD86581.1 threonine--tRNA ligase [Victivallis vadensis]HJH03813.1 threonine--tRNA ligase [Victivallis vadensis]
MSNYPLETIRHSAAHVMAAAVQQLYPDAKFDIGPSTENGFYYDFDMEHRLVTEDLKAIEKAMKKLIGRKLPFECFEMNRADAEKMLSEAGQTYKLERLADIPEDAKITFYKTGDFVDLCRGPHVANSGEIGAVKLLSIAGSYFRGDEKNKMLQRIYGTAFASEEDLQAYLKQQEEAAKRDHRKLGVELDLFSFSDNVGPGLVLWHPKGAFIRHTFETFWKEEHYKNGYELLYTPHIGQSVLWETSGHLSFYKDGMYSPMQIDEKDYYVKPMNCPFHIEVYQSRLRSYRELPLRWAELGTVYRYEKSGALHGLLRVRGFTQDDSHIICTPEQIEDEIAEVLRFSLYIWKSFGFTEIKPYLSTRPAKAVGEPERWEKALVSLRKAIDKLGLECEVDEGGGAFYGPKIDLKVKDAIGREWQTATIQFDFNLPERFDMTYIGEDGKKHRPYMVHRALMGSLERFFGILIEQYAGAFPLWLAPEQARILPVSDKQHDAAMALKKELRLKGFRVEVDVKAASLGAKIKDARKERIPYMLVVGEREAADGTMAVRNRREGELGTMTLDQLVEKMRFEVDNKII